MISAVESYLSHVDPATHRIRPELRPLGTATGRFSCREPNLQAIPKIVLDAFIPADGHVLLEADFSQIELRVLAHFSRDPAFLEAYTGDVDIHRRTAAAVRGIPEDQVSSMDRHRLGKAVNFGIVYGETEYGLAESLGVSVEQARNFITGYFRAYPVVAQWIQRVQEAAFQQGWVQTLYGRRRYLSGIGSRDAGEANRAGRQAVNSIIQGTAADINKLAIARLYHALPADCRLLLTVHDSVLLEVPARRVEDIVALARRVVEVTPPGFAYPSAWTYTAGEHGADARTGMESLMKPEESTTERSDCQRGGWPSHRETCPVQRARGPDGAGRERHKWHARSS